MFLSINNVYQLHENPTTFIGVRVWSGGRATTKPDKQTDGQTE